MLGTQGPELERELIDGKMGSTESGDKALSPVYPLEPELVPLLSRLRRQEIDRIRR